MSGCTRESFKAAVFSGFTCSLSKRSSVDAYICHLNDTRLPLTPEARNDRLSKTLKPNMLHIYGNARPRHISNVVDRYTSGLTVRHATFVSSPYDNHRRWEQFRGNHATPIVLRLSCRGHGTVLGQPGVLPWQHYYGGP